VEVEGVHSLQAVAVEVEGVHSLRVEVEGVHSLQAAAVEVEGVLRALQLACCFGLSLPLGVPVLRPVPRPL
jgi:hypothetical protein